MRWMDLTDPTFLAMCFDDVRRRSAAPGIDGVTPEVLAAKAPEQLGVLSTALRAGTYHPSKLLRLQRRKPEGGERLLSIPTVIDRVVIEVLRRALGPAIEAQLSDTAYAYRPGRSARAAVEAAERRIQSGCSWAALGDIKDFFDTIPIRRALDAVRALCVDEDVFHVVDVMLRSHATRPGRGLAQGSALSPALSNLVLTTMDRRLVSAGVPVIRYCDNLCSMTQTERAAREALATFQIELSALDLELKPAKSKVAEVSKGFLWLGFWLGPHGSRVSDGAVQALRERLDATGDISGEVPEALMLPILRGWAQYFNAPLPDGASLGKYDKLARALLAKLQGPEELPGATPTLPADNVDPWETDDEGAGQGSTSGTEGVERLLLEAEELTTSGAFAEAERRYELAQQRPEEPPREAPATVEVAPDEEAIDAFIGLFCAGQDMFESAPMGRRDFEAQERPPGPADVLHHLSGQRAIAVRPRLSDGTCTLGVIDIDGDGPSAMIAVRAYADALTSVARAWAWQVLIEETGGRGMHLWVPIRARVPAERAARCLIALERAAGTPAGSVRVERFPAIDSAPELYGACITLPLGAHAETGAPSRLVWANGAPVERDLLGLFEGSANEPAGLFRSLDGERPSSEADPAPAEARVSLDWTSFGKSVERVMMGCAILRRLAEKAAAVGHLDHGERLSLLYSLGHLGPQGERAIHAIIGRCRNYDVAETTRQIGRLNGLPIGCARLREKHGTTEGLPSCPCSFDEARRRGGYATPLLHAIGFRRAWRDILHGRREAAARVEAREDRGVAAIAECTGDVVTGAPPHEWA